MQPLDQLIAPHTQEAYARIAELIENASTIAISAHTRPDGDAVGSTLAMQALIKARWPEKQVTCLLADDAPVPRIYRFLLGAQHYVTASSYADCPDLFIALDVPTASRLAESEAVMKRSGAVCVIDHHPSDNPFATYSLVRTEVAATGMLVYGFALCLGIELTPLIANQLFCALVTDTGRFQYQNADVECFKMASMLVDAGADPSWVALHVYQNFRLEYLRLEAVVMGRIVTLCQGKVAYSYATRADIERTGAHDDECDGLIDQVRSVAGVEVALFLKEGNVPGIVRGNLRAKGTIDVAAIANQVGGGGHRAAAGFSLQGTIDDVFAQVFPLIKRAVEEAAR